MPTIALVDDDRNILTSVSIALEAEGYRITTYTDGASALDGFKTTPPDQCTEAQIASKDAPAPRAVQAVGSIIAKPLLGGLHHQYVRI